MEDISLTEMQEMQRILQEKYFQKWGGLSPEKAAHKLLWLYGELGEAGDIIKKQGNERIMNDPETRRHFIEEMCDVMMFFHDVMLCYGVTPEEMTDIYREKFHTNLNRW